MDMQAQIQSLRDALAKQGRLFQLVLQGPPPDAGAFASLSGLVEVPFAVVDFHGHVVFNNTHVESAAIEAQWPWRERPRWVRIGTVQFHRRTLMKDGQRLGNILFRQSGNLPTEDYLLLGRVADIVAQALLRPWETSDAAIGSSGLDALVAKYLAGDISAATLCEHAAQKQVALPAGDYFCVLYPNSGSQKPVVLREALAAAVAGLEDFLRLHRGEVLQVSLERGQLLIVPVEPAHTLKVVKGALSATHQQLEEQFESPPWRAAVSRRKQGMAELADAVLETEDVARVCRGLGVVQPVSTFHDFEFAFLFEGMPRERMLRYCRIVLRSLHDGKSQRDQRLMASLESFIDHDAQMPEAAAAMGIHKNTMAYRLDQVSSVLGLDLRRTSDLLRIKLAFTLRRIIQRTEIDSGQKEE
ncbi:MAG: helix-turn-helix domain-containing protein [Proteobacteria bacterium]|nr:helix-turn-helix domain-containing protein [Pseudomonadota bacterium]